MAVLLYTVFGLLLVQSIYSEAVYEGKPASNIDLGADPPFSIPAIPAIEVTPKEQELLKHHRNLGNLEEDARFAYSIPAIPALSITPEELEYWRKVEPNFAALTPVGNGLGGDSGDGEDLPFSIPAIPAMELTPEEEEALLKHYAMEDPRFAYSIPAIPALSISPEELENLKNVRVEQNNDGSDGADPPFSIPAIPAMELTPEEERVLLKHYANLRNFEKDPRAYSIPAIPALSISPEELEYFKKVQFAQGVPPFSIPAIPAMKVTPEEEEILMRYAQFRQPEEDPKLEFSFPAIPAMKISPEELLILNRAILENNDDVFAIPPTPAWDTLTTKSTVVENEPIVIPAIPASKISPEEKNDPRFYSDDYEYSFPAIPAMSLESLQDLLHTVDDNQQFMIPAIPALNISPEENTQGTHLRADTKKCMKMVLSLQKIPRMLRFTFDAAINATQIGLPLLKQILECSKGDFMETMVCLGDKESEIKDFVLILDKIMKPPVVDLHEHLLATRQQLFECLQIDQNSTLPM